MKCSGTALAAPRPGFTSPSSAINPTSASPAAGPHPLEASFDSIAQS
jgi:hypothetical protein